MIWFRIYAVVVVMTLPTCAEDRIDRLERQMRLVKSFQSHFDVRLDTIEGDFGSLTDRVLKLESLVDTSENDSGKTDSNGPRTLHNTGNSIPKHELNDIKSTLKMYKHSFAKQKKEMIEVIGKAKEVVGINDEQISTIENGIMVTIRTLHSFWSDWSAWSDCSHSCDRGIRTRNRICDVNPPLNDSICIGNETATEECVVHEYCPFDSGWSLWGSWGQCDVTCGNGTRSRDRTCGSRASEDDGDECQGDKVQTTACVVNQCPVNGGWSRWSLWGSCSSTCGIGMQRRDRTCDNTLPSEDGNHCFGDSGDNRMCTDIQCPVGWTTWSDYSTCSVTCGTGLRQRSRSCQNPLASLMNSSCSGNAEETEMCSSSSCTVGWTTWSDWNTCSVTCGTGLRHRSRSCQNPLASLINNSCSGNAEETQMCSSSSCTVGWTSWSGWTTCSVTCGIGLQKRSRSCQNPMTSLINDSCSGDPTQFQTCTDKACSSAFTATGYAPYGSNSIRFPSVILNEGNDYNSATGVFTCRVPGLYLVTATIGKGWSVNVDYVPCYIQLNWSNKLFLYHDPYGDDRDGYTSTATGTFRLQVIDRISVGGCSHRESIDNSIITSFSAVLLRPDQL